MAPLQPPTNQQLSEPPSAKQSEKLSEQALIKKYFTWELEPNTAKYIDRSVGDDAAQLTLDNSSSTVISNDTSLVNIHFLESMPADAIAWRSLAIAVSDLAASGAEPVAFTMSLTLPEINHAWLQAFSHGLKQCSQAHRISLIGGDLVKGPLSITPTVIGKVNSTTGMLRRKTANIGDLVVVSGELGASKYVWDKQSGKQPYLTSYHYPRAQIDLGLAIKDIASSAIDISDGLLIDAPRLVHDTHAMALNEQALESVCINEADIAVVECLANSDDYQLLFTLPASHKYHLEILAKQLHIPLTVIGKIVPRKQGPALLNEQLQPLAYADQASGWDHFST